jgi:hypothetical protein
MSGNSSADETAIAGLKRVGYAVSDAALAEDGVFTPQNAQSVVGKGQYAKPMTSPPPIQPRGQRPWMPR